MPISYRVIYSPRSSHDLRKIFKYLASHSELNAAGLVQQILDAIDSLYLFPHRHPVDEIIESLRGPVRVMVVAPYLIFYRNFEQAQSVELITIRHGARRMPKKL